MLLTLLSAVIGGSFNQIFVLQNLWLIFVPSAHKNSSLIASSFRFGTSESERIEVILEGMSGYIILQYKYYAGYICKCTLGFKKG